MAAPMPRVPPVTNATRAMIPSLTSSWPGLSRPSTSCLLELKGVDVPHKAGHDDYWALDRGALAFHAHRNAHAAADAQGGEAFLGVALPHLIKQRHQHPGAGRADRMADGDGAAVDVDLAGIPAEVLVDGASLRRERLVGFDEVEVAAVPAGLLQRRARGRDRAGAHDLRIDAGLRPRHDTGERRLAEFLRFARRHQDNGGGAVIDARRISSGDRAFLVEGRPQLADRFERGAVLGIYVGIDHDIAFAALDRHRRDLVLELAGLLRGFGFVLRLDREFVLLGAGDLPLLGDVLGGVAHVVAVEGVPQAVPDHRIDHLEIAHLHARAQIGAVRRDAHGLLAAGNHDVGIAVDDSLIAERHRAQPRAAQLVDAPGRRLDRNAG